MSDGVKSHQFIAEVAPRHAFPRTLHLAGGRGGPYRRLASSELTVWVRLDVTIASDAAPQFMWIPKDGGLLAKFAAGQPRRIGSPPAKLFAREAESPVGQPCHDCLQFMTAEAGRPVAPSAIENLKVVGPGGRGSPAFRAVDDGLPAVARPTPECSPVLVKLWRRPVSRKILLALFKLVSETARFLARVAELAGEVRGRLFRQLKSIDDELKAFTKDARDGSVGKQKLDGSGHGGSDA